MSTSDKTIRMAALVIEEVLSKTIFPIRACHIKHIIRSKYPNEEHVQYWKIFQGGDYSFAPSLRKALLDTRLVRQTKIEDKSYYQYIG